MERSEVHKAVPLPVLAHEAAFLLGTLKVAPSLCEVESFGERTRLEPRVMQVLVALSQAEGAVLTRDDLISCCWGNVVVGDDALNRVIGKLRRLSESVGADFQIETLPRVGYRLISSQAGSVGPAPASHDAGLRPKMTWTGDKPVVAILAFDNDDDDKDDDIFLASNVAARVHQILRNSPWLVVKSNLAPIYDTTHSEGLLDLETVCRSLGAQYLLRGRLRFRAQMMEVSMSLADSRDNEMVWSKNYEISAEGADHGILAAQIAGAVEAALLTHEESRALDASLESPHHWEFFLRGRWHVWRSTRSSNALGQTLLGEALALKPHDVPTLALLVFAKVGAIWAGWVDDPVASRIDAERLALKAVAIDPTNAFAHFANGAVLALSDNLDRAIAQQRRALELNPYFDLAAGELGRLLIFSGHLKEGETYIDRAFAAGPNSPHIALWTKDRAAARFLDMRYADAVALATEACAKRPNWFLLHYFRAACLAAADRKAEARAALAEGRALLKPYPYPMLRAAHPFARSEDMNRFLNAMRSAGWDD